MKLFLNFFILILVISSCQDEYNDASIQNGADAIVIEGMITNKPGPYLVKISKAVSFNQSTTINPLTAAKVSIIDENGIVQELYEKESGKYYTSATGITGQIGKSYKIKIITHDGDTYESETTTMPPMPKIDLIYGEIGELKTLVKDNNSDYVEVTKRGINAYIDITPVSNQKYYYKIKSSIIQEIIHVETPMPGDGPPPSAIYYYCWYHSILEIDKNLKSDGTTSATPIKKLFVGFMPDVYSNKIDTISVLDSVYSLETHKYEPIMVKMISGPNINAGTIINTEIYSVPASIYEIYTQENKQIKPTNTIFDPIPTKIESNIICVNEPSKPVYGYFTAASVINMYHYFQWSVVDKLLTEKNIVEVPGFPTYNTCDTTNQPDFWISKF